jgi:hypothetical protein
LFLGKTGILHDQIDVNAISKHVPGNIQGFLVHTLSYTFTLGSVYGILDVAICHLEGIEIGMAKGMEKGRAEGMEEGMSQRSLEIARKMLAKGMDEASIMDMTGLTAEEIKLLKAEM